MYQFVVSVTEKTLKKSANAMTVYTFVKDGKSELTLMLPCHLVLFFFPLLICLISITSGLSVENLANKRQL